MKIFAHIDKAITKTTEFINEKTENGSGWGEKVDSFLKPDTKQMKSAAKDIKDQTVKTFEKVGDTIQTGIDKLIPEKADTAAPTPPAPEETGPVTVVTLDEVPLADDTPVAADATPSTEVPVAVCPEASVEEVTVFVIEETEADLKKLGVPDLKALAKERGLTGYSRFTKAELIAALLSQK